MCDVAAEAVVMNGYAAQCIMINRDVRRLFATKPPDGTQPDMEQKANLCIYEVPSSAHLFIHIPLKVSARSICLDVHALRCIRAGLGRESPCQDAHWGKTDVHAGL